MRGDIPPNDELLEHSHVLRIPLVSPFRGLTFREVMVFEGPEGPGEWAPFVEYEDDVSALWLRSALEQSFDSTIPAPARSESIRVNATFPALNPEDVPDWWARFPGALSAKVKVGEPGQSLDDDYARIAAIRSVGGPNISLRLDANGRWSVAQALTALERLQEFDIEYVEQPAGTVAEMLELRESLEGTGIRLAADELIRQSHQLDQVIDSGAAEVAVLKVSPLGGIRPTLERAREAHHAGLEVVISSALETSVGLSWGVRAAALLHEESGSLPDAGLGTATFLEQDAVSTPLLVVNGSVAVAKPKLDAGKIETLTATPERTAWWHERLRRCLPRALELLESEA